MYITILPSGFVDHGTFGQAVRRSLAFQSTSPVWQPQWDGVRSSTTAAEDWKEAEYDRVICPTVSFH